tara:strand:+ start:379 stop:906 length:528 start_codon:yes stop_codon:yes gene_type:complete
MTGTPLDIMTGIRGVQLLIKGYNGYSKGSRIENDKLVRNEIARATARVRSHMQTVFDTQFREGNLNLARPAKRCIEECNYLIEDVNKASSGMEHAFLSGQRSPSNKDLKKLIKHDHEVIEMVTKAVNLANSSEHSIATGEGDSKQLILETIQKITSCRGFFGVRMNILSGLKNKK